MDLRKKAILCAAPYLLSIFIWFSLTGPVLNNGQTQDTQLQDKRKQELELKQKLADIDRLRRQKTSLTQEIEQLRNSVPKNPNIDLLMLDLEKIALSSGMDIVSLETPTSEEIKQSEQTTEGLLSAISNTENKNAGNKSNKSDDHKKNSKTKDKSEEPVEIGLSKDILSLNVVGDYESLIKFVKELESYQRVVGIDNLKIAQPEKERKGEYTGPHKTLDVAMLITAYYLP